MVSRMLASAYAPCSRAPASGCRPFPVRDQCRRQGLGAGDGANQQYRRHAQHVTPESEGDKQRHQRHHHPPSSSRGPASRTARETPVRRAGRSQPRTRPAELTHQVDRGIRDLSDNRFHRVQQPKNRPATSTPTLVDSDSFNAPSMRYGRPTNAPTTMRGRPA